MRRYLSDDSGAVVVIVAIVMTALIGVAAIAVDQGYLYDTRHQLQSAADAAALAGCSRLIETRDSGAARAAAIDYAARNANGAGTGLTVDSVTVDMGAEPWSVRVAVSRPVPAWFAGIFGIQSTTVHAVSKAAKYPLIGAKNLMPWGIPIMRDNDVEAVEAVVVSDTGAALSTTALSHTGLLRWSGAVTAPSTPGGYDIRVAVRTAFPDGGGVTEWVGDSKGPQPAGRVVVGDTAYPFASITVTDDYGANDESFSVRVDARTKAAVPGVSVDVGKKTLRMGGAGTNWSIVLTPSDLAFDDGFLETHPLNLRVDGDKKDSFIDAYAHVRRSTYPVKQVTLAPGVASGGEAVSVDVVLNEFDPVSFVPGRIYTIRVGPDGVETGNFGELNFKQLDHHGCPADPVGVDLGNNVKDWVQEGYGGGVHVGDIVPMSPGRSGWTERVVNERIEKYGDVIIVPIVSKYEEKSGGSYDCIVRAFGAFRITEVGGDSAIRGEFIEYVATPHMYGKPGQPGAVYQARLVNP